MNAATVAPSVYTSFIDMNAVNGSCPAPTASIHTALIAMNETDCGRDRAHELILGTDISNYELLILVTDISYY